ncbi:hypothetical protein [Cellvibrio sp. PSBB006]|jgi:hypothetical protein|uniref:hypothetical protein n=1 Tax=Cellvibrio sp. PSBB006 TaxID=1987723 RepID=UPI000B3B0E24|nr:hypothetical protein [Cellvibrio sp. PSBB006]ARU27146.1 hypothetical protein CBR65_06670 [Cellvibrio sp. PSBB006]
MPAPLVAAALSAIGPALARRGLDLLSGVFRGALDKGTQEIAGFIEEKTGIDINDVADEKLTEEQWAKLREFEFQYQAKLLEYRQQLDANALELEKVHQADRADARDMQKAALSSDDKLAKRFVYFYATGLTLLTFLFIFYAAFVHDYTTNPDAARVIDTVLGFLLGVSLSAIIQYFFGSSAGSKSKEEKIRLLTESIQVEHDKALTIETDKSRGGRPL